MNLVYFSTSGVDGSYVTLEEIESGLKAHPSPGPVDDWPKGYYGDELTFLVVQPRLVGMTHGNVKVTLDDIPFLKKLRASTWKASRTIGKFEKP